MYNVLVFGMTENPGGVESFLMNYYRRIDRTRFHFDFLCNSYDPVAYEDEIHAMGGRTVHFTSRRQNPLRFRKELEAFFAKHAAEYDAVWVNVNSLANIDYLKMARKYGIPRRIIHSHNAQNMDTKLRGLLHEANRGAVGKYATDFWACSEYAARWFYAGRGGKGDLRHDAVVIRNAIDVERIQAGIARREELRRQAGAETLLDTGLPESVSPLDTGLQDTGSRPDTGPQDTGSRPDTGLQEAGSRPDMGRQGTGSGTETGRGAGPSVSGPAAGWEDPYLISCIGRLHFQKNQKFAIDVLEALLPRMPDARLLLIGQGEDEEMLRAHVRDRGLEDKVRFAGIVTDIPGWLGASDFFLFPSVFEGLGIAGLEAQASGLPTLASAGVIPEEIAVTDRLRFYPLDRGPEAWAAQIVQMRRQMHARPLSAGDPACGQLLDDFTQKGYNSATEVKRLEGLLEGNGVER